MDTHTQTERQTDKKVSRKKMNKRGSTHERKIWHCTVNIAFSLFFIWLIFEMEKYLLAYGSKMNTVVKMSADLKQFLRQLKE
jgi:hypothetical protein